MIHVKHTGIYVRNLDKMRDFYQDVFDMKVIVDGDTDFAEFYNAILSENNKRVRIAKLITERGEDTHIGDMIELVQVLDLNSSMSVDNSVMHIGVMHIALGVSDLDNTIERVKQYGGKVIVEPVMRENGNWLSFCRDIEGNWIELIQN